MDAFSQGFTAISDAGLRHLAACNGLEDSRSTERRSRMLDSNLSATWNISGNWTCGALP